MCCLTVAWSFQCEKVFSAGGDRSVEVAPLTDMEKDALWRDGQGSLGKKWDDGLSLSSSSRPDSGRKVPADGNGSSSPSSGDTAMYVICLVMAVCGAVTIGVSWIYGWVVGVGRRSKQRAAGRCRMLSTKLIDIDREVVDLEEP
ncbi:MAG: hypothetical protein ABFC77_12785 [Thermoguttaceae bacterium]